MRALALALLLLLAACTVPDEIADLEDAVWAGPQGTVYPTETARATVEPPGRVRRGVTIGRGQVVVDREGRLTVEHGGQRYLLWLTEDDAKQLRVTLEAIGTPRPGD